MPKVNNDDNSGIPVTAADCEYLAFVRQRAASVDYQIEARLRNMDELAEIILTARKSYLSKKINEDIL